jgi:hypothetical protein
MSVTLNTTPPRRLPVPPRPRTAKTLVTMVIVLALAVGLHVVAVRETQFSLPELATGWHGIWSSCLATSGRPAPCRLTCTG